MKKISIRDVAKKANVSITVVSQIINGKGERFTKKTKEKVLKTIDELGYVPNAAARSLKIKNQHIIGVIVPTVRIPFFADVIASIQDKIPEDVSLLVLAAKDDQIEESINRLLNRGVDGIILARMLEKHSKIIDKLKQKSVPYIVLDQAMSENETNRVIANDYKGGYLAATHLLDLGHQNVCVVVPEGNLTNNISYRLEGFLRVFLNRNLPKPTLLSTKFSKHGGTAIAKAVKETKATAVFAMNDELAIGLISGLHKLGIKVPDNISIIGYDNTDYAEFIVPSLTTISQPTSEIGEIALNNILKKIGKDPILSDNTKEIVDVNLVVRESTRSL